MRGLSRFQAIRNNKIFETFIILIIIASALLVGIKTYEVSDAIVQLVRVMDWVITVIFVVEISIRFIAEERKLDFFKSGWNVFDTLIVLVSLIPIDNTDMALVARLLRVFRVMRMISIIPELRMLLNSLLIVSALMSNDFLSDLYLDICQDVRLLNLIFLKNFNNCFVALISLS